MCHSKENSKYEGIIKDINEINGFGNDNKKFYIFIGTESYKGKSRESKQLILKKDEYKGTIYKYTEGKVAFIPEGNTYPSSFFFLMKLLFDDFNVIEKLYDNKDYTNTLLVKYLYNKGYLFLNAADLDQKIFEDITINYAGEIIFCGKENKNYTEIAAKYKVKNKIFIHPSANNIDRQEFTNCWIKHTFICPKNKNINLNYLIIKK